MIRSRHAARWRGATLLAAVSALALAACGSDSSNDSSTTAAPAATDAAATTVAGVETTAAAPAEMQKVRLANFGHLPATLPYDYALQADLFNANGIELVENAPIYNAADAVQTLFSGDADMGYVGISAAIQGQQAGRDVKVVAVVAGKFPLEVALTNDAMDKLKAQGITADSPITDKVNALKGLKIASPAAGSTTDLVFRYSLSKYGINPDSDLTIQPVGDSSAIVAAARQGVVDGVLATTGGPTTLAVSQGDAQLFISFASQDDDLSMLPIHVLVTSSEFLAEHPDAVKGVVEAFHQARQAITAGVPATEMATIKDTVAPDMDQALWDTTIEQLLPLYDGSMAINQAQYDIAVRVVDIGADTPTTVTIDQVVDNSVVEALGAS